MGLSKEELDSEKLFPTLTTTSNTAWTGKTFKATIEALIASEKLTEQEKATQAEAQKAMEGWQRLSLNLTKADCIRFNEMTEKNARIAKMMQDPWYYKPTPITYMKYEDDGESFSVGSEMDMSDADQMEDDD